MRRWLIFVGVLLVLILFSVPAWIFRDDITAFFTLLRQHQEQIRHYLLVGRDAITLIAYLLTALAAVLALFRIKSIIAAFREFGKANPKLLDLFERINELRDELIPAIDARLSALQTQVKEQVEGKLVDLEDQLDQRSEVEDVKAIQTAAPTVNGASSTAVDKADAQKRVSDKWQTLVNVLRAKVPDGDMRRISQVATRLADRRRNNPLSEEDVKLIEALRGQYRRLLRADSITSQEVAEFSAAVDKAIQRIQAVGQRTMLEAAE